jgi:hypothetical protein
MQYRDERIKRRIMPREEIRQEINSSRPDDNIRLEIDVEHGLHYHRTAPHKIVQNEWMTTHTHLGQNIIQYPLPRRDSEILYSQQDEGSAGISQMEV